MTKIIDPPEGMRKPASREALDDFERLKEAHEMAMSAFGGGCAVELDPPACDEAIEMYRRWLAEDVERTAYNIH